MSVKKSDILLNTPDDVNRVRAYLIKQQGGVDPITGDQLVSPCLDHSHDSQLIRGALSREINVLIGKIENCYKRNISYWCVHDIPFLLRGIADYLEREHLPIYHPGWKKVCTTAFNKLNASQKDVVLYQFGIVIHKPNQSKRKVAFAKLLSSRTITFGEVMREMEEI